MSKLSQEEFSKLIVWKSCNQNKTGGQTVGMTFPCVIGEVEEFHLKIESGMYRSQHKNKEQVFEALYLMYLFY